MIRRLKLFSLLVAASMLIFGLAAPAATAVEMQIPNGSYVVVFNASGVPNGLVYDLVIDGVTYTVTSASGDDKTVSLSAGEHSFSFPEYIYNGSDTRYACVAATASPVIISGPTPIGASYAGTPEYKVTFDQTGLLTGTNYEIAIGLISTTGQPMTAGVPYVQWVSGDNGIHVDYPAQVSNALGAYDLWSVISTPDIFGHAVDEPAMIIGSYVSGNITGTVFYDLNGNGIQDPGEPGVPGATVELLGEVHRYIDGGAVTALTAPGGLSSLLSTTSDGNGDYAFNNLPAGTFYVRVTLQDGSQQDRGAITLAANNGVMNSGQADFPEALPYTGK